MIACNRERLGTSSTDALTSRFLPSFNRERTLFLAGDSHSRRDGGVKTNVQELLLPGKIRRGKTDFDDRLGDK